MTKNLSKALVTQRKKSEPFRKTLYGSLGIPLNGQKLVQVPNRQSYVYVRLNDNQNEVIQAFNNTVAPSYDLPVVVMREGGRYTVKQVNTQRYENNWNNNSPYLPSHGTAHSFYPGGGADISWIYSRQIMHGLVFPNVTGTTLDISSFPLYTPNGWILAGATGTVDLLQYRPVSGSSALMALLYADAGNGNPGLLVNSGSYMDYAVTGSVYPYIPRPNLATQIPLAAIRLSTGTLNVGWDNLYDVRQWIHSIPSGTSSSGSGIDTIGFAGLYNGVPLGTGTFLNVRSNNAVFSLSGTMFDLFITGSGIDVHNFLYGLQGGLSGEYYHLSSGTFWDVEAGGGWKRATGTYTFLRSDAPSYEIYTTNNITGSINVGMKFQVTHLGQQKNFFITAMGVTGSNTYLNLYGGTDYTLNVTGSMSQPLYSTDKSPYGFPITPAKWTVTTTDTVNRLQTNPVAGTWYNLGSVSITAPIGVWKVEISAFIGSDDATATDTNAYVTLSTANNSESNPDHTSSIAIGGASGTIEAYTVKYKEFLLTIITKTPYFLNEKVNVLTVDNLQLLSALSTTAIRLVCMYL